MRSTFSPGWLAITFASISALLVYSGLSEYFDPTRRHPDPLVRTEILGLQLGLAALLSAIAFLLKGSARARGDEFRTQSAEMRLREAIASAVEDKSLAFTLYLRPFALTNRIAFENPDWAPNFGAKDRRKDIERLLAEAVETDAILIGLGRPGEHEGAGRLLVAGKSAEQSHIRDAPDAVHLRPGHRKLLGKVPIHRTRKTTSSVSASPSRRRIIHHAPNRRTGLYCARFRLEDEKNVQESA